MKNFIVLSVILMLCACSSQNIRQDKPQYQGLVAAQNAYQRGDYQQSALAYEQLFERYKVQDFLIYAADSWLQLGDLDKARLLILDSKSNNHPLLKLMQAELSLGQNNHDLAQQYLYSINENALGHFHRSRYLHSLAQVYDHQQDHLNAALTWIALSEQDDSKDVTDNVINSLMQVEQSTLNDYLLNAQISDHHLGWLEAAQISFNGKKRDIDLWKSRWGNHPALVLFSQTQHYKNIAVLLPLSGRYQQVAKSIQQGMMAAMYHNRVGGQQLQFFDTGSDGEHFSYAWYGAIESGAEFIIGPLEKNSIEQMLQLNSSTIPVLLLNNLPDEREAFGVYQFSLAPNDEVISAASRLVQENKKRVMLLAPESEMGRKLAVLFEKAFNAKGGQVVSHAFYPESTHDYSREITQALGLNEAKVRARRLQTLIGHKLNSAAQVRPDLDAIYMISKPKQARLIKPQLKFYKAEDVPVFATSQVLSKRSDVVLNRDLNGIKFSHSGFVIDPASLQEAVNFDTEQVSVNKNFFAFGFDAASVVSRLEWLQRSQQQQTEGMSGKLSVDTQGKVHRELNWGQFVNGSPVLLPPIDAVQVVDDQAVDGQTPETTEF